MKRFYKLLAVLLVGFAGGCISPVVWGWLKSVTVTPGDAVSIANTYIVFTTIIFVGFTVVLGIAGYVFTQQFSATKESQENQVIDDIRSRLAQDDRLAIQILDSMLNNADVKTQLANLIERKVDELIEERLADTQAVAAEAAHDADTIAGLAAQLKKNGKGESQ